MSVSLDEIKRPISREMALFEQKFATAMQSSAPLLDKIMHYIVKRKGKQMRPMFVFFSAGVCGGISNSTYNGASLIELLHTATLVHDDVVDDSNLRRGFFSVNALWKNKIAVLVGDYLLSRGLLLSVQNKEFTLLEIVARAVREISEGELLQIEKARKLDIREEIYFDIIRQKTASLIAACCASGAASAGSDESLIRKMHHFGELIGIAFQIKDDLFDFESAAKTGKPSGIDLKETKMTLPLIHVLDNAGEAQRKKIINIIKNNSADQSKINEVVAFIISNGGIDYARKNMMEYREKAFGVLKEFPESEYKTALIRLVQYTTEREK
jgi:octaprenyl-diphosphate synthase